MDRPCLPVSPWEDSSFEVGEVVIHEPAVRHVQDPFLVEFPISRRQVDQEEERYLDWDYKGQRHSQKHEYDDMYLRLKKKKKKK